MRRSDPALSRCLRKAAPLAMAIAAFAPAALANPVDPTVASGSATFSTSGNALTVVNTPGTIINWQQFNIGQGEITKFIQQSAQSTVLNRIGGQDPSQILGTLQSNGRVFLVNPNGILFGHNAVIDVAGLVASNLNLANADFLAGRFNFAGGGAGAVVNQGAITTPVGGSVYLIGSEVRNEGIVTSPRGEVLLAAGSSVQLADTGTPAMSVTLTASGNRAVNLGTIGAEGGRIDIYGALIEQQGVLRADSAAVDAQGRIVLKASGATVVSGEISATNAAGRGGEVRVLGDEVTLTDTAKIDVSGAAGGGTALVGGDYQGKNAAVQNATITTVAAGATIRADALDAGNGGRVIVWADDKTYYDGLVTARGGANGGDGGFVETSGHSLRVTSGRVDTTAAKGATGMWLLDPAGICINDTVCTTTLLGTSVSYDQTITSATLDSALQSSNVSYSATDFLVYQASYTVSGSVPTGRNLSFYAPYIYFNGTLNATGKSLRMEMKATGTSATLNGAGGSSRIDFGSSASLITGGGNLRISASNASISVDIASGASINAGTGSIELTAWKINTSGTPTFTAKEMEIETGKITGQISVTADYMLVDPWGYDTGGTMNTYLGLANGDARCASSLCLLNQLTGNVSDGLEITSSNNLYVEGTFNNPAKRLALVADHGILYLNAPLSVVGLASEPVAAILGGEKGFVNNAGANAITTTYGRWAIITADPASLTPGGLVAASQIALASVFSVDYTNEDAFWDALMAKLNPAAALGNVFGYWALQVLDPCQVDPISCAPASPETPTTVNQVIVADTSGTKGIVTYEEKLMTAETPAAKEAPAKEAKVEKKEERKEEGRRAEAGKPEHKADGLRRAKEEDERKSPAELKQEARQARAEGRKTDAEARKTEAEARKAEVEAKKAETEAKASKAEDRKADAESRRRHAEAKKAESESKKAEAEAKEAEAEAKEAAAEAKVAGSVERKEAAERRAEEKRVEAVLRKAEAEVKKAKAEEREIRAEAKKAEAEAKKAEAEVRKAATEAKQKAEVEVKKAEVEVKKAAAEAKKAEAEAKRAEAERKVAERREEIAKSFAKVHAGQMSSEKLAAVVAQRHEFKTETLAPALSVLDRNPKIADMPICAAGGSEVCVPAGRLSPPALPAPPAPTLSFLPQIQRKVAVVIGIDKYSDPAVPPLEAAVKDALAVGDLLKEKFGYEVRVLQNANRTDIVKGINAVARSVGADDSVAIYYAGHGYLMEKNDTGYWIPGDGSVKDPSGWINNDDIARLLNAIPARQVMLVSDSCYSGTLAREAKVAPAGSPAEILGRRSVTVMSSGGEEPVSDEGRDGHSIFAWNLMNTLKGIDGVEAGSKTFDSVRGGVVGEFPQVPRYGAAASAGYVPGGDYLFEVRSFK